MAKLLTIPATENIQQTLYQPVIWTAQIVGDGTSATYSATLSSGAALTVGAVYDAVNNTTTLTVSMVLAVAVAQSLGTYTWTLTQTVSGKTRTLASGTWVIVAGPIAISPPPAPYPYGSVPDLSAAIVKATGSTTYRGLGDRFADVVNVKDFGAVGDGVTDDTAAFTAASVDAGGTSGQVFVPMGTYKLTSTVGPSVWLMDNGANNSGGYLAGKVVRFGVSANTAKTMKVGSLDNYVTTGIRAPTEDISDMVVLSTIGQIGMLGGSKTSLSASAGSEGCIGLAGFANNDNSAQVQSAYGQYLEARRQASTGKTHGQEIDIVNFGSVDAVTPGNMTPAGLSNALWLASGGGATLPANASVALGIINNAAKFDKGIVFGTNSLVNPAGEAVALGLDANMAVTWYSSTTRVAAIRSDATAASVVVIFANPGIYFQTTGGVTLFSIDNSTGILSIGTAGVKLTMVTAAPTTGTWARGDRAWNSQPAVGSPKGWICTASGTPGTWVSEGNL